MIRGHLAGAPLNVPGASSRSHDQEEGEQRLSLTERLGHGQAAPIEAYKSVDGEGPAVNRPITVHGVTAGRLDDELSALVRLKPIHRELADVALAHKD